MNVLAIDSSNLVMGVAITNENHVLGEMVTNLKKNHSIRLMPAIEQMFNDVDLTPQDIDRIAVAQGPGSYTGVRIGVSIAKSMAWALDADLVGVSSLEVVAQNGRFFDGIIVPFFDARRGRVYTGMYERYEGAVINREVDQVVPMDEWLNKLHGLDKPVLFLSNDLNKHQESIQKKLGDKAVFGGATLDIPRPSELAQLALTRQPEETHSFTPTYIQMAEAEAKWKAQQQEHENG